MPPTLRNPSGSDSQRDKIDGRFLPIIAAFGNDENNDLKNTAFVSNRRHNTDCHLSDMPAMHNEQYT